MTTLTITHTPEDGTLLSGTARGDGSYETMCEVKRTFGKWEWFRSLRCWGVRNSRGRQPDHYVIRKAAEALRATGWTVEVELDTAVRSTAELEAARAARQEDRVAALDAKADRKAARAVAADAAVKRAHEKLPPGGEPVKIGHHSQRRHERALDKAWKSVGKSVEAHRAADYAASRADAAAFTTEARYSPITVANRIETLEAEQRAARRNLDGHTRTVAILPDGQRLTETTPAATGERRERIEEAMAQRALDIEYWKGVRAQQIAEGKTTGFGPADFEVGDFAQIGGSWRQVMRVSAKSVSVVDRFDVGADVYTIAVGRVARRSANALAQPVKYAEIRGRRTEAEVRAMFPDAFARLDRLPTPPKKKGGKVKLTHDRERPFDELWTYEIGGVRYDAHWKRPGGWYSRTGLPIEEPGTVDIRTTVDGRSAVVDTVELSSPVIFIEDVHNQIREYVEGRAKAASGKSLSTN